MQLIGFLGGMSWESTAEYYRLANELVRERLGGLHSARCVLYSVDFAGIERMQVEGRWDDGRRAARRRGARRSRRRAPTSSSCARTRCTRSRTPRGGGRHAAAAHRRHHRRGDRAAPASAGSGCSAPASRWRSRSTPTGCAAPGSTCSCPSGRTRRSCTGSSTTSCASASSGTSRATAYRRVIEPGRRRRRGRRLRLHRDRAARRPEDSPVPTFPTTRLHVEAAVERALAGDAVRRPDLP